MGVGSLSLLQGIIPTQGLNPGLLHCRWVLYQLSHKGRPRILEWVAYPFSSDLPDSGMGPGSPALQVDSLPTIRETLIKLLYDPAIPHLGIYPEKDENSNLKSYIHPYVHRSTIYNSQDMEAT